MSLTVFTNVFNTIDSTVQSTIIGNTSNMVSMVSPVLLAGFTVYVNNSNPSVRDRINITNNFIYKKILY